MDIALPAPGLLLIIAPFQGLVRVVIILVNLRVVILRQRRSLPVDRSLRGWPIVRALLRRIVRHDGDAFNGRMWRLLMLPGWVPFNTSKGGNWLALACRHAFTSASAIRSVCVCVCLCVQESQRLRENNGRLNRGGYMVGLRRA